MRSRLLAGVLLISASALAVERGQEIRLWPNGAPGSEGMNSPEIVQEPDQVKNFKRISNVNKPSILVFLPPREKATGVGIVVAPGGGHQFLVIEKEGYDVADWLNRHGIAAFVLKYRLARSPGSHYTVTEHALPDANRAVRLVRSRAKEWDVDPETRFDSGNASESDAVDRVSSRPDFAVVVYPGFRPGSVTVPKNAPPTFLVCADDDRSHVTATVELYSGLEKQSVSSEMHIYASGGHGFGLRDVHAPVATWDERLLEWMADKQLLKAR
jgi:acetyl esterase/lipase